MKAQQSPEHIRSVLRRLLKEANPNLTELVVGQIIDKYLGPITLGIRSWDGKS